MIKKLSTTLIVTGLSVASITATAASSYDQTDSVYSKGFYIGADLGYGMDNYGPEASNVAASATGAAVPGFPDFPGIPTQTVPTVSTTDSGFAWGINTGYFFNKYFGAELNYLSLPTYKVTATTDFGAASVMLTPSIINLLGTARLPLGNFAVFAQLGYGYLLESMPVVAGLTASASASAFAVGAGVDYKFNKNMGVDLKWSGDFGGTKAGDGGNFSAITAGYTYYI